MEIEYEATFTDINKDDIRERLKKINAELIKPEFLQKRVVFNLPKGHERSGGWLRVRDEEDQITMSLKIVDGDKIQDQKEIQLKIDSFEDARQFLINIGAEEKAFQESKRELWKIDGVEVTIDEWPFLEPFVEVEGKSEVDVKKISEKLNFDYYKAKFCSVDMLYHEKYDVSVEKINNETPKILFEMDNPFVD